MMNKDETVMKLSKAAGLSMAHAEDLYDSFFEKPVVPQYVADWYEVNKDDFEVNLFQCVYDASDNYTVDSGNMFWHWLMSKDTDVLTTLVNMHQFGYEVKKEPRYTVRVKGIGGHTTHLNQNLDNQEWFFGTREQHGSFRSEHTRKELESNGFGWVFDCEGIEVKEVDDGND